MASKDKIPDPIQSPQDAVSRIELLQGENENDYMTFYEAMRRYGVSRSTFRQAALTKAIPSLLAGGVSRKVSYLRRQDVIDYISRPASRMATNNPAKWRQRSD